MNGRWLWAVVGLVGCHSGNGGDEGPFVMSDAGTSDGAVVGNVASTMLNDASVGNAEDARASTQATLERIDQCAADNPAKLSSTEIAAVRGAGQGAALKWLYPFDGTVFPRGLRSPQLMWESNIDAKAIFLSIKSKTFEYQGCLVPSARGRVALTEDVWSKLNANGFGLNDPFQLELHELDKQGVVRAAAQTKIVVAPGSLKGSIFYNSYASRLAAMQSAPGGAVLRIRVGKDAEVFAGQRGCVGCHSVSANGSRLVASGEGNEGVYALTTTTPNNPSSLRRASEFVALSPDGRVYVAGNGGEPPGLYVTDTGVLRSDVGLPATLTHPMFSPTGTLLTFVDAPSDAQGYTTNQLALMDYDAQAQRFSNYRAVVAATQEQSVDWPNLLPDNRALVYQDAARGQLMLLDLSEKKPIPLARAMGFASQQQAEMATAAVPGSDRVLLAAYPTVVPLALGGFYWVFFDSDRKYGNINTNTSAQPSAPIAGLPDWLTGLIGGAPQQPKTPGGIASRQLWGAAIEVSADGTYKVDPSHPPFYLDGQEIGTNNHRAFAALDPCTARGGSCQSGIDCCDGFCESGMCVAQPKRCAKAEEACTQKSDCCDGSNACINGFCSVVTVPLL